MAFWRKSVSTERGAAVVGVVQGESLALLRGVRDTSAHLATLGTARVRLEDLAHLPDLLRARVHWRPGEPVVLAGPTPPLFGEAVSMVVARHEEGQAVVRDRREVLHAARWQAVDHVRERTAQYFACTLEDVSLFGSSVAHWRETEDGVQVVLVPLCTPPWGLEDVFQLPATIPVRDRVLLPLVLAAGVGNGDAAEGVLHLEEDHLVLVVRRRAVIQHIRTVACGAALLSQHCADVLSCSPHDAELVLGRGDTATVTAENLRLVRRILRPLLPLWAGALEVLGTDLGERDRSRRLRITGRFPTLMSRLILRRQFLSRCAVPGCRLAMLGEPARQQAGVTPELEELLAFVTRRPVMATHHTPFSLALAREA